MQVPSAPRGALWRQEAGHLGRSGLTIAFNQLLQLAIPFVTTSMTGRLGVDALAAGSLVGSIGLLLFVTALGVLQGLVPLVSMGIGAGDDAAATRAIRGGLFLAVMMGLGATAIMAGVPWCLARTGQDPALVVLAQRFIWALLPGYLPSIVAVALRFFLIAANDLKWLNPIIIAGTAFNLACNLSFAGGASAIDGLMAIGLTVALTNWLMFGLLAIAMWHAPRIPKGLRDRRAGLAVREVLRIGIPVGAIFLSEASMFTASTMLMGYFGKVALGAHGIVVLWLNICLMIPVGISQAAMARLSLLLGQRDVGAIRHAITVALIAGSAASIAVGVVLVTGSDTLVRLLLRSRSSGSEAVIETARGFFRFCAVVQLLSGLVIVMSSILRGLRDANAVLWRVMLGYWGVGLGGAVLFAFGLGFGSSGIWIGITLAFVFAVVRLGARFPGVLARLGRDDRPEMCQRGSDSGQSGVHARP
ncbi:MAG: multidrug resistance protein family [Bradyrhizobium sp.]|jgi:MATE family multidrug resistance protein|nr:multidrug resistance protein family [Bradyrhizobium sp.]